LDCLQLEGLRGLPLEVGIIATKVTIRSSLVVDGAAKVKLAHDASRAEIKVVVDDLEEISIGLLTSAVGVNENGQRLSDTDGVGNLNQAAAAETSSNEGLGDPTGSIGSRAINLGGILSGEGTTTVSSPTTIGVDDDLTASKTGITLGTTDNEAARGVQVVEGLLIEVLGGDDLVDDLLLKLLLDELVGDILRVLSGDNDGVNTERDHGTVVILVLNGNLSLGVGTEPSALTVLTGLSEALAELGGEDVSQGHHLGSLVGGITEHVTLKWRGNDTIRHEIHSMQ
jgi:hypothetical protein